MNNLPQLDAVDFAFNAFPYARNSHYVRRAHPQFGVDAAVTANLGSEVSSLAAAGSASTTPIETQESIFHATANSTLKKLCEKYPLISTYEGVFNGRPHIKGTRFTVADVLTAICTENSIDNILEEYDQRFTEAQLKEAIQYARDFILSVRP